MASRKEYEMLFQLDAKLGSSYTSTFSKAKSGPSELQKEIRSLQSVQADISAYTKQQAAVEKTQVKLDNLNKQYQLLQQEIKETNGPTTSLERESAKLEQRIGDTSNALATQKERLSQTAASLSAAGISTERLGEANANLSDRLSYLRTKQIVGHSAQPSSPERIFIAWVASIILQERVYLNHAGNQNIPSRAEGANLDALGELFYQHTRPAATSSTVTMRFNISEAQTSAVLIPKGTRVSNGQNMFWATVEDRYIAAGQTHGDVTAECMTAGTAGNGYLAGQIATIVDVFDYYTSCTNLTESGGGSDAPTDDEFYEQLRQSEDNYSTAGPKGGYIAKAKAVSNDIADVLPNSPTPGEVRIYVLMEDGTIAGQEVKNAVLAACNADETRPLTDHVLVEDPETVEYDIDTTYYLNRGGPSAADVQSEVNAAVDAYVKWQAGKLGRDINPSELTRRMMVNGVKRVVIRSPVYTELRSGNVATDASGRVALADLTDTVPQVGKLRGRTVTSGGYEDE